MRERLPWVLFVASLLLNAVFLAGAVFGWTTLKSTFLPGQSGVAQVTRELSLTPEQVAGLEAFRQDIKAKRGQAWQSRGGLRSALLAELRKDAFDRPGVEAMMAERSVQRRGFFADIAEELHGYLQSLSPTQRARFFELAAERGFMRNLLFDGERRRYGGD